MDSTTGRLLLTEVLLRMLDRAERGRFEVRFRWVRRSMLQDADDLSKLQDRMNFSLRPAAFQFVTDTFGPWDIDRYAASENAICARFNAALETAGAEAADALSQNWAADVNYILPDFHAVAKVLDHIERCNCRATLIVPEWRNMPWWHRLWSGAWARRIQRHTFLPTDSLIPRNKWCFFGSTFRSRMLVLQLAAIPTEVIAL